MPLNTKDSEYVESANTSFIGEMPSFEELSKLFEGDLVEAYYNKWATKKSIRASYIKFVEMFSNLPEPIKIYRGIGLYHDSEVETDSMETPEQFVKRVKKDVAHEVFGGVGIYWSWDKSNAKPYNGMRASTVVVLEGKVNKSEVDWAWTLWLNIMDEYNTGSISGEYKEKEVRLKEGAKVQLDRVWVGNKAIPVNKMVTAKKKTSAYDEDLTYADPEVPMTDEDIENINTTDAVPTQNAMDMTKIPHPEAFKEVESKGVFFIGGDSVNVDPRGDETPFGIDYPNHFNGWAVGANVGQKLKKKADEGYYYVAVVSYPSNSSMHVNPSFISAMERKLKSLCQDVGVSFTQVMNEAEHYFQEQEAEKQKEELKTKKKTTGQDTLFEDDVLVGTKEVKKDLTFYKKVIDLLKKREVEDIKERGGNVRTDAKISIKNVLLEVETEISHKNTEQYKGNIVGVAKFAEVITGKDRVVKHEVYPEEIIFNNWKMLPEPIPVAELFSALESKVKPEDIQKTFWVMLQTYNLTVTKDHPIAQFLMDFAEEGMVKTSTYYKNDIEAKLIKPLQDDGFSVRLVGSVALKGQSEKDVDIALEIDNEREWNEFVNFMEQKLGCEYTDTAEVSIEDDEELKPHLYEGQLIHTFWNRENDIHIDVFVDGSDANIVTSGIEKTARKARQDDSLPVINKLISMGYDKAQWHIHELLHKEVDICDSYDGKIFDLKKLIDNCEYSAPIFSTSHPNCYCYLLCYSTTNPDLEVVVVDWTGIEEGGRVVDRADAGERKADFERLFDKYREDLDNIENNSYIHGEFGEPEAGIYSFDLTMYDDTYFNVNELQEIRDKVLELVLDRADRYGIVVDDAEIAGNSMIVQTSAMLRNYDFTKEDWVEVEWTYNKRREELINVIMDLSKLQDWLKVTQDSINNLLLEIEQKNANQQMDKFSGLRKTSKLNLSTIRQFFTQERDRGVVDDKILNELQMDLLLLYKEIYPIQQALYYSMFTGEDELRKLGFQPDEESSEDNDYNHDAKMQWIYDTTGADPSDERASYNFSPEDVQKTITMLERAKTDKQKILAINYALNEAHTRGYLVDMHLEGYNKLRETLGRIQAHHMRFIVAGRVDFLREKFLKTVESFWVKLEDYVTSTPEDIERIRTAKLEKEREAFNQLVESDPTKNKQYLQWLIKGYLSNYTAGRAKQKGAERFLEDLPKIKSYLEAYYKLSLQKKDLGTEEKVTPVFAKDGQPKMNPETGTPMVTKKTLNLSNIDHIENWQKLQDIVKPYLYGKGVELSDAEKEIVKEEANLIYDGQDWQIWVPNTEKSACILGKGTEWCTTYGYEGGRYPDQTQNQFEYYSKKGDLIIFINKNTPEEKYQWHFESDQFMDKDDGSIDIIEFLNRGSAEELKEPLHDYLINRKERDDEYDVNSIEDISNRKINNLVRLDAPFEKIEQLLKNIPPHKRKEIISSARLIDKAVKSGLISEDDANSVCAKTGLYFKDGKCYWLVDDWSDEDLLSLFDDSGRGVNLKSSMKHIFSGDNDIYYDHNVEMNNYYLDIIDKDNIKRIKLYLKENGIKVPRMFTWKDVDSYIYENNLEDLKNAIERALTRAQESADEGEYWTLAKKAVTDAFGEPIWFNEKLGFEINPQQYSDGFKDEDGDYYNNMSGILSEYFRDYKIESRDLWNALYHGISGDIDDQKDYFNERLSEELDDLGAPEVPVKPIKKVKKAINKILREGIFRKKSMLEKLSRLDGFTVEAEKKFRTRDVKPTALESVKQLLQRTNSIRDFTVTRHFSERVKQRTKDSGKGVYEFLKTYTFTLEDVSEVAMSDDLKRLEAVLFEIRTPANVTGVEDVIYIAMNVNLRLITFYSQSSTGQRITTPQRYATAGIENRLRKTLP